MRTALPGPASRWQVSSWLSVCRDRLPPSRSPCRDAGILGIQDSPESRRSATMHPLPPKRPSIRPLRALPAQAQEIEDPELVRSRWSPWSLPASLRSSRPKAPSLDRNYSDPSRLESSPSPYRPKLALPGSLWVRARHRQRFPCCCFPPLACVPPIGGGGAESAVGGGHHLRADPRWFPVPSDGAGRVQPEGGGLGHRRSADGRAGPDGVGDGAGDAGCEGRRVAFPP